MSEDATKEAGDRGRGPHKVRMPRFVTDEEIGLGDVVKRATAAVGIRPCGGCEHRAATLNRWMMFGPGASS